MIEILDPNWIANILSISFTLVIFLLGIPVLYIQTYVPEDLRAYYIKSLTHKKHQKDLLLSIILLLVVVLLFGNHGTRYILTKLNDYAFDIPFSNYFISKNRIIIGYYIISLTTFLLLSYNSYRFFKDNLGRVSSIKLNIIDNFFNELTECLIVNNNIILTNYNIAEKDFLENLNLYFKNGSDAIYFSNAITQLIKKLINCVNYSGKEVQFIFDQVLIIRYIDNFKDRKNSEIDQLIQTCKYLALAKKGSYDDYFIPHVFLYQLVILLIDKKEKNLIDQSVNTLRLFNSIQDTFFKIYYYCFENKMFSLISFEINNISRDLLKSNLSKDPEEIYALRVNLVAYLSFYFAENYVMKQFAAKYIKQVKLNISHIEDAQIEFEKVSKFETANKIYLMKNKILDEGLI